MRGLVNDRDLERLASVVPDVSAQAQTPTPRQVAERIEAAKISKQLIHLGSVVQFDQAKPSTGVAEAAAQYLADVADATAQADQRAMVQPDRDAHAASDEVIELLGAPDSTVVVERLVVWRRQADERAVRFLIMDGSVEDGLVQVAVTEALVQEYPLGLAPEPLSLQRLRSVLSVGSSLRYLWAAPEAARAFHTWQPNWRTRSMLSAFLARRRSRTARTRSSSRCMSTTMPRRWSISTR